MLGSLDIGRLFGIRIRVSWLFVILLGFLLLAGGGNQMSSVLVLMLLLVAVLLHELGHALVAQSFGIRVLDITFWPLGGMARMSDIPESPRIEAAIAVAGPAVNFALALLTLPFFFIIGEEFAWPATTTLSVFVVHAFLAINLSLGLFNLLPAFPMDGGRLLRAFLATRTSWLQATESAVRVGRWMALGLLIFGLWTWRGVGLMLPLIAMFVWLAGASELVQVRLRHGVSPLGGASPFGPRARAGANPFEPSEAEAHWSSSGQEVVSVADEEDAGGARRPKTWVVDGQPSGKRGFSEEDIRRLENYRGRLSRDD